MRQILLLILLLLLLPFKVGAQSASVQQEPNSSKPSPESFDPCAIEPAYEYMLGLPEWKQANTLYQVLLAVKPDKRVTPEQRENIRMVLTAMGSGDLKPDPDLMQKITDDFAAGASLHRLTKKQKAGLAINMQFAMGGVNDDYMPNVSTSLAFISSTLNDAGVSTRKARKIVDDVYELIAKARSAK